MTKVAEIAELALERASIGYAGGTLFSEIELEARSGEWIAITGPNGSGKTTLLKTLAGILPVQAGTRKASSTFFGYVPQRFLPSASTLLTTREFLRLRPRGDFQNARDLLSRIQVSELLDRPLRTLSGGQMQRALFAFSLLGDPPVLFMDEAMEGVDLTAKAAIIEEIQRRRRDQGVCVIEVTHDLAGIADTADRVIFIHHGIVFDGDPKDHSFHECVHTVYGRRLRLGGGRKESA